MNNREIADQAFENAIDEGRLSLDEDRTNYAGDFMFMGRNLKGVDCFKHIHKRTYIK